MNADPGEGRKHDLGVGRTCARATAAALEVVMEECGGSRGEMQEIVDGVYVFVPEDEERPIDDLQEAVSDILGSGGNPHNNPNGKERAEELKEQAEEIFLRAPKLADVDIHLRDRLDALREEVEANLRVGKTPPDELLDELDDTIETTLDEVEEARNRRPNGPRSSDGGGNPHDFAAMSDDTKIRRLRRPREGDNWPGMWAPHHPEAQFVPMWQNGAGQVIWVTERRDSEPVAIVSGGGDEEFRGLTLPELHDVIVDYMENNPG